MGDTVDDLAHEGLEHDSAIACNEFSPAVTRNDHTLADVGGDRAKLARASALDIRVELRLEVLLHARHEVGRVQHNHEGP